ncbi:MAG: thiamine phosphate synthase [Planctomycetes bacterium]|nr:thiamine phosphate synthase [Planctomycetota bacterium]
MAPVPLSADERRARLAEARLMLVFTPALCAADPREVLAALAPWVDAIQVRPKAPAAAASAGVRADPSGEARATWEWALVALDVLAAASARPLLLVNDRVDVALALAARGVDGVHLGQDDLPPRAARALLGAAPLVGLSTHDAPQVVRAQEEPVDYLGFGPVFATATKGYARGLGPEAAWVAAEASPLPVFPIGGIDAARALELEPVGRAAVSAALLAADDPAAVAAQLRAALE